jgi:ribonuclease P protein subunit RPR2
MANIHRIAVERMEKLFRMAIDVYHEDPDLSRRYTDLIKRIVQRTRTKIPKHIKRNICKKCGTVQIPGFNSRTRIRQKREPHIARTCQVCGHITRYPFDKNKKD